MGSSGKRVGSDVPFRSDGKVAHKDLNKVQKKAYSVYTGQLNRCHNKNASDYAYYGGKGVKVEYSRKEFMSWYVAEFDKYPGSDPTVGRIDHSKNYSFSNIRMDSFRENRSERWKRCGPAVGNIPRPVGLFSKKTGECIATFPSVSRCSIELELDSGLIHRNCSSKKPKGSSKHSWYYRFLDDCR